MKFLIDNNLSPRLVEYLSDNGFESVHVKQLEMQKSSDEEIFQYAHKNELIIVSADTDFGFILSTWDQNLPSVILFRNFSTLPDRQIAALLSISKNYSSELIRGSIIIIEPSRTRIKTLPF